MSPFFGFVCVAIIIGLSAGASIIEDLFNFKHSGKVAMGMAVAFISYLLIGMAGYFGLLLVVALFAILFLFLRGD